MRNACHVPPHHRKHSFRHETRKTNTHTHTHIDSNTLTPWSTNSHGTLLKPPSVETEELLKVSITWIMCCMNNVFLCSFPLLQSLMRKSRSFTCPRRQSPPDSWWAYLLKATSWSGLTQTRKCEPMDFFPFVSLSVSHIHRHTQRHPFLFDVCQSSTIPYSLPLSPPK